MSITQTTNDSYQLEPSLRLKELFCNYTELTKQLKKCASGYTCEGSDERADNLLAEQTGIIRKAVSTPATNIQEIMLKMAIWRRDAPDLETPSRMYRHDALAYSVFRDLVVLTGAFRFLTEIDRRAGLLREVN